MNTRFRVGKNPCRFFIAAVCWLPLCLSARFHALPGSLSVGSAAPDFNLPDAERNATTLRQFRGKWVVLYFYPKDYTAGCTREAHNFQKDLSKYEGMNAVVVGVSVDTVDSHKGFCAEQSLGFKLLSDADHRVSGEYGSLQEYKGQQYGARNTYVIDPGGKIRKIYLGVNPANHSQEVLDDLRLFEKER